ncbi:hypothetical protein [Paraburkholderia fungorum]|uniref:hypothetical protein n=1 Tax=Paraburkholderia fungorum TaxID=134537 RepID=UPI0038BAD22F
MRAADNPAAASTQASPQPANSPELAKPATAASSAPGSGVPSGARSQASSTPPLLAGATRAELVRLLDAHDLQTLPNGTRLSRNNNQDQENMARLGTALERSLTGQPPEIQQFEQKTNDMQAQLYALPRGEQEAYAGALATIDVAFRDGRNADGRQRADEQLSLLGEALRARFTTAVNDPVEQALGMFNHPVGAGYLTQPADQQQLDQLTRLRDQFTTAATPEARQRYFAEAAGLKNDLQHKVATAIEQHTAQEAGKWQEANAEVDRIIHEAESVTGNPGKRYELIGRQLYSANPGSGRDDLADRRLLAFTQRMRDDPAVHDKLAAWSFEAGRKLNDYGVDAAKDYLDILNNLPPAGPDYVRDLADQYNAVLHDASYKDYTITPRARGEKLATQILEGTARFLLGMTPFAPLSAVLDAHSSLSENARLGIDLASGALGLVVGEGATAFAERLAAKGASTIAKVASEGRAPKPPVPTIDDPIAIPSASSAPAGTAGTDSVQTMRPQRHAHGLNMDAAVAETSQRINRETPHLPEDYVVKLAPDTLKPAPGKKGILTDNKGRFYITSEGKTYSARFDNENGTWRVYQPDNAYRPQCPVRLDAQGNWQVHNDVGLKGGMMNPDGAPPPGPEQAPPFAEAFQVSTPGGAQASPEMQQTLNPSSWHSEADRWPHDPGFVNRYKAAFDNLSGEQQRAIRNWTYLDVSETYSTDSSGYEDVNFDLNQQLYSRTHESDTARRARALQTGLSGLPRPEGESRLIRISEVPSDYTGRFAPGDYVTNSPAFMSAASNSEYIEATLADRDFVASPGHAFALYDIRSQSGTPFVPHISTLATGEHEWLFRPNTVFRVDEIATAASRDGSSTPRIGIRLTEVPINTPTYAKNIHTGMQELVYPSGTTRAYTVLQPTRTPPVRPTPPDPHQPPHPTHGDPNQPGPSTA